LPVICSQYFIYRKKPIALILVILLLVYGNLSAGDLNTLNLDNTAGAVTLAEIDRFDDYYKDFFEIPQAIQ